jgi:hypothetical protein
MNLTTTSREKPVRLDTVVFSSSLEHLVRVLPIYTSPASDTFVPCQLLFVSIDIASHQELPDHQP